MMDALNPMRSLYLAQSRMTESKRPGDDAAGFLDTLSRFSGKQQSGQETIDGLPVEPEPVDDAISPIPEYNDDNIDPRILLTQKLFVSLIGGGFPTIPIPERPEIPIIDRPMA